MMKKWSKLAACLCMMIFMIHITSTCFAAQKKVAVTGFSNSAGNNYGRFVSGILQSEVENGLVQNKNYTVVERTSLNKIFQELGLQNSGVVDSNSAIEIGKLAGADYTVLGNVVSSDILTFNNVLYEGYKAKVKFSVKIVDNKSGVILISDIVEGSKSVMKNNNMRVSAENLLNDAATEAAYKVLEQLNKLNPLSGTVISVNGDYVYFDLGFDDGVKEGDIYTVYKEGKMLIHPVTGEVLGTEEETIGLIKIREVKSNYAVAEIKKQKIPFRVGNKVKR